LCVANGLHVPPIAYKLRSLSDLPGLILQVAGTPTHGVLVSVSVSAVVYARILVSDRIGACPYRPFSTLRSLKVPHGTVQYCTVPAYGPYVTFMSLNVT